MGFIIKILLSYIFFVYIVKPFFNGLLDEKRAPDANFNNQKNDKSPKSNVEFTDYEEI